MSALPDVDVVIPIYKNAAVTQACLSSVERSLASSGVIHAHIVLINDASPEEDITTLCRQWAQKTGWQLIENPENLGFVASVNLGMALHPERDVILLNSDTEVAGSWLQRMQQCAYQSERIGTVTPLSNNATICSYPVFLEDNPLLASLSTRELDEVVAQTNAGISIEIPTAVGFCMYIRRDCLNEIGLFDVEHFGKGYGEETDFSRRASRAGWQNVCALDTFVLHQGGVSFGEGARARIEHAEQMMYQLHPDYGDVVSEFVRQDPLKMWRDRIDDALLQYNPMASTDLLNSHRQYRDKLLSAVSERFESERLLTVENIVLREQIAEIREQFEKTDQALGQAQHIVTDKNATITLLSGELETIKNSKFWRYTAFIRKLLGTL
ncbi:glycosyltransferase family 2 protein [Neptunomonas concharum]|uniref:Glycosyltransferase family 2 protein n=1 Tax=Neptunomonas concharum TaxID=1031538 RepID=A0A5P1R980_9GAMM|nr:glycosyltransferase family 2 protein [Neptunomonas concharum]QEQ95852.1 glycosyltransferase family 2 protein [Neptunomonas concharum]